MKLLKSILAFLLGMPKVTKDPASIRREKSLHLWQEAAKRRKREAEVHDKLLGIPHQTQMISSSSKYTDMETTPSAGLGKDSSGRTP